MSEGQSPTTAMGDWYANLVPTCRGGIVICTNERTLLTAILPLVQDEHPLSMFTMRVYNLLRLIGVPAARADAELKEMLNVEIRKTQSRKVLGSMNEIALSLQLMAEAAPVGPLNVSEGEMLVAESIFAYTKHVPPAELVRALLCSDCHGIN